MDNENWCGLTVRTHEGAVLGVVVGVFAEGPLAGRLRVQGAYCRKGAPRTEAAIYAIPRSAVLRKRQGNLLMCSPASRARGTWLMHVLRAMQA